MCVCENVCGIKRGLIVQAVWFAFLPVAQQKLRYVLIKVACRIILLVRCVVQTIRSHALPESDQLDDCKLFLSIGDSCM